MARRRGIATLVLIAALGFSHAPASHAQFGGVVYDPANYVQNFYTAVRSYTQIIGRHSNFVMKPVCSSTKRSIYRD